MEALTCSEARLTRLDISGLTKLWYLNCAGNSLLVTLNLQGAESLYELWAGGTSLKVLDISGNSKLRKLVVSPNKDLKESQRSPSRFLPSRLPRLLGAASLYTSPSPAGRTNLAVVSSAFYSYHFPPFLWCSCSAMENSSLWLISTSPKRTKIPFVTALFHTCGSESGFSRSHPASW